jgi:hypothetical protein
VKVEAKLRSIADFGALGYFVCKHMKKGIPYFQGIENANTDMLKALGAALAAYGSMALFHAENVTPEARREIISCSEIEDKISVSQEDIEKSYEEMSASVDDVDLIALGCPHASIEEIRKIASLLRQKRLRIPMWIFTSRATKAVAERAGYVDRLEKANVKILADTCPVVMPTEELGIKKIAVNSGKATFYLSSSGKVVVFESVEKLIEKFSEKV